jgi:uncharacterized RDD family membrane protein YckC
MTMQNAADFNPYRAPENMDVYRRQPNGIVEAIYPPSLWRRAVAWFVDSVILVALFVVFMFILSDATQGNAKLQGSVLDVISSAFLLCTGLLYFVGMTTSPLQATVGKLAMGLRVRSANGGRASGWTVLARELLKYPCLLVYHVTFGADLTRMFTRERRERGRYSYDVFARTCVVRARSNG